MIEINEQTTTKVEYPFIADSPGGQYGISDKEGEIHDLEELADNLKYYAKSLKEFEQLDKKYGFGVIDTLQELSLEIDRKIEELRNPPTREDYILEREGL